GLEVSDDVAVSAGGAGKGGEAAAGGGGRESDEQGGRTGPARPRPPERGAPQLEGAQRAPFEDALAIGRPVRGRPRARSRAETHGSPSLLAQAPVVRAERGSLCSWPFLKRLSRPIT